MARTPHDVFSARRLPAMAWCAAVALGPVSCASAGPLEITHRGNASLPTSAIDQNGQPFTITGLSGIAMIPGSGDQAHGSFIAVMDNSSRLIRLALAFNPDGSLATAQVTGGITLADSRDYEGIAATDAARGTVLLGEEGTPAIHEYRLSDGALVRTLPTPAVFSSRRANFGFESLTARWLDSSPTGARGTLWTCNEEALTVDGNLSTASAGSVVRLVRYTLNDPLTPPAPGPQYAYITEPIHGTPISGSRSGVSDMVLLPDARVLTLERSLALSAQGFFQTRIFSVDFTGVTDVSGSPGLIGQSYTPISTASGRKTLLWAGDLTNLEGLTLGPRLPSGHWTLVGVVDDADPISVNRLSVFELKGVPSVPLRQWRP